MQRAYRRTVQMNESKLSGQPMSVRERAGARARGKSRLKRIRREKRNFQLNGAGGKLIIHIERPIIPERLVRLKIIRSIAYFIHSCNSLCFMRNAMWIGQSLGLHVRAYDCVRFAVHCAAFISHSIAETCRTLAAHPPPFALANQASAPYPSAKIPSHYMKRIWPFNIYYDL